MPASHGRRCAKPTHLGPCWLEPGHVGECKAYQIEVRTSAGTRDIECPVCGATFDAEAR